MNLKTISYHLHEKSTNFLLLFDKELRKEICNDFFITGGSIVSLLNYKPRSKPWDKPKRNTVESEPEKIFIDDIINDIDIYFTNKKSLLKVIRYFLNALHDECITDLEMKDEEKVLDQFRCVFVDIEGTIYTEEEYLADDTDKIYMKLNIPEEIRALMIDTDKRENFLQKSHTKVHFITSQAINLLHDIQIITRFCGSVQKIHSNFDFVHCKCFYNPVTGIIDIPDDTLLSLKTKELRYVGSKYPLSSLWRAHKFIDRGWKMSKAEWIKIALQISRLDFSNPHVLKEQLTGVYSIELEYIFDKVKNDIDYEFPKFLDEIFYEQRYGLANMKSDAKEHLFKINKEDNIDDLPF